MRIEKQLQHTSKIPTLPTELILKGYLYSLLLKQNVISRNEFISAA